MRKRRVVGRTYGMRYSCKGHKDRIRLKKINRSGHVWSPRAHLHVVADVAVYLFEMNQRTVQCVILSWNRMSHGMNVRKTNFVVLICGHSCDYTKELTQKREREREREREDSAVKVIFHQKAWRRNLLRSTNVTLSPLSKARIIQPLLQIRRELSAHATEGVACIVTIDVTL